MNIQSDVSSVFQAIRDNFPKYLKSAMIAASKALTKTIKETLKNNKHVLSEQRRILKKESKFKNLGGKIINAITSRYEANEKITVGFLFKSKKLEAFLNGGTSKWEQYNNQALAKIRGKNAPFLKPGNYAVQGRPVIDRIANDPNTKKMLEQSAYNAVQRSIGLAKAKAKGKKV